MRHYDNPNAWDETLMESEADARAVLENESCQFCDTVLGKHYASDGHWIDCDKVAH
jgi:hypothetical protein